MQKIILQVCLILLISVNFLGCDSIKAWFAKEFKQATVSDGVARLATQHMSIIVSELAKKIKNSNVEAEISPAIAHEDFGKAQVTYTLKNTQISYESEKEVFEDCLGNKALWQGSLEIISGSITMFGRLTGNKDQPVIPDPQTVAFKVRSRAHGLSIRFPSKEGYIQIDSGELEFDAIPRLAQSRVEPTKGLRVAQTSNFRFENVKLTSVKGMLISKDISLPIEIDESNFIVQVGIGENGEENFMKGFITLFGQKREVSLDGKGLDPNYDREEFIKTYACNNELAGLEISYQHEPLENKLAPGVAGLSTLVMGEVIQKLKENHECGMKSPKFLKTTTINVKSGDVGISSNEFNTECIINFDKFETEPDCHGNAYVLNGAATVSYIKQDIFGFVVSDQPRYLQYVKKYQKELNKRPRTKDLMSIVKSAPAPSIPHVRRPATLLVKADLKNIELQERCLANHDVNNKFHCKSPNIASKKESVEFKIISGQMSAEFKPMLAKNMADPDRSKICSEPIPMSEGKVTLTQVKTAIIRSGNELHMLADGSYNIVLGEVEGKENQLSGSLTIGRLPVLFSDKDKNYISLKPDYKKAEHEDSFKSCKNISIPSSDADCSLNEFFGLNIMRLAVLNAGSLLRLSTHKDVPNSFQTLGVARKPIFLDNENTVRLDTKFSNVFNIDLLNNINITEHQDLRGNKTTVAGVIEELAGHLIIKGQRTSLPRRFMGINYNPFSWRLTEMVSAGYSKKNTIYVKATESSSTSVNLTSTVYDFVTKNLPADEKNGPQPYLVFKQGTFTIDATPIMGRDTRDNSYSIGTPVVSFDRIKIDDANIRFEWEGMSIPIFVSRANIRAHSGLYEDQGNFISGDIKFATGPEAVLKVATAPFVNIRESKLDPNFDQKYFDSTYAATPNLAAPITPRN